MVIQELLAVAANEMDETEYNAAPEGVRVGDILSNGWAGNRNPLKLFMFLGVDGTCFRGCNVLGKEAGPLMRGNRVRLVMSRDTPDLWRTWEELAKALAQTPNGQFANQAEKAQP